MPIKIEMPRLSDTMQAGTVVKWNVKEGQAVKTGDVIADIETDKATMELQSFDDGTVAAIAVPEGKTVPIGTVIVLLAKKGEDPAAVKAAMGAEPASAAGSSPAKPAFAHAGGTTAPAAVASPASTAVMEPPAINGSSSGEPKGRIFASPLARKIAAESGVDLSGLEGTGPGGRIVRKDVEAAMASSTPAPKTAPEPTRPAAAPLLPMAGATLAAKRVPLSSMRRTIATRLVQSKQTIPHYQVTFEVDMDALLDLRKQLNEQLAAQGVKLSVNDFLVRACALAMHQHPLINARWVETGAEVAIDCLPDVNIGVAIALDESRGGGLVVATLRQADRKGLRQLSAETKALSDKARSKGLSIEEMSDSTFTISNLGMFGVDHFTAIINPPNAAILAVGAAIQKPVVKNGQLAVGHVMSMTMSSDHRVIDGAMAAAYLATVKGMLERPATLLV